MDRKAWALLAILASGILLPLGRIWEQAHPAREICPPCLTGAGVRPMGGGTCGALPRVNAICPDCGRHWHSSTAPQEAPSATFMNRVVPYRRPTVFNDPWYGAIPFNEDLFRPPAR